MRPRTLAFAVASTAIFAAACSDAGTPASTSPAAGPEARATLVDARTSGRTTLVALTAQTGTCLAVRGAIVDDQYVGTAPCDPGSPAQQWILTTAGTITPAADPRWCIDVSGQRANDGDAIVLGSCAGIVSQRWTITTNSELKTQLASGRCVTATNGAAGTARMRSCGTAPAQQRWFDVGGSTGGGTVVTVASVTLAPSIDTLAPGQSATLVATARDAAGNTISGRAITWSSSNAGVATVTTGGLVTAVAAGSATIRATVDNVTGSATVLVVSTPQAPAPVASVTVGSSTTSLQVGGTLQLSATTRDASGSVLTGRSITWSSSNVGIASVNGTGVVTGSAAGTAVITATSEGVTGSISLSVVAPPPPSTGGTAEPTPTSNIIWRDDFNGATSAGAGYARRGVMSLVPGRNGGQAIRFHYTGDSPDNLIEKEFGEARDFYMTYWFRTSPGADPTSGRRNGSGMKWLMLWRANGPRYTNGVGDLDNGGPGAPQTFLEFTTHDNSSLRQPNPFLQNISKTPKFGTTNDGQWHRYTIHVVSGNGGYEQIWIDGTLVLDNRAQAYDHVAEGVNMFQLPGLVISGPYAGYEFTVDLDDMVLWRP